MARGFGSTKGSGTTDKVGTVTLAHPASMSEHIVVLRNGAGGGNFGRICDGTGSVHIWYYDAPASTPSLLWQRDYTTTDGQWSIPIASTGVWYYVSVAHTDGSTPVIYKNGSSEVVGVAVAPVGTIVTSNCTLSFGNRAANDRVWDGNIAEYARWGVKLTAAEQVALGKGFSLLLVRPDSLLCYIQMVRGTPVDIITGTVLTVAGTAVQPHPRIILPTRARIYSIAAAGGTDLVVQSALQSHTAGNIALTQDHILALQNAAQAQSAGNIALTQVHVLAVANATQTQAADNLTLTQAHQLVVQNAAQAQAAESLVLTQLHILAVANASQAQTADNLTLSVAGDLVIANAAQAHSAGNIALTQAHSLTVANATQAQTVDNLTLTQVHVLVIANASHSQAAEGDLLLTGGTSLAIASAAHAQLVDSLALGQVHVLAVANALHAHTADSLGLTQLHYLVIADAAHGQTAGNVLLSIVTAVTPGTRVLIIPAESRTLAIAAESRTVRVYH